jgi:hypothetical protein
MHWPKVKSECCKGENKVQKMKETWDMQNENSSNYETLNLTILGGYKTSTKKV